MLLLLHGIIQYSEYVVFPEIELKEKFTELHNQRAKLHEKKKNYFDVREDLIKTGAVMVLRRKELIAELAFIYPIVEVQNKTNALKMLYSKVKHENTKPLL